MGQAYCTYCTVLYCDIFLSFFLYLQALPPYLSYVAKEHVYLRHKVANQPASPITTLSPTTCPLPRCTPLPGIQLQSSLSLFTFHLEHGTVLNPLRSDLSTKLQPQNAPASTILRHHSLLCPSPHADLRQTVPRSRNAIPVHCGLLTLTPAND